MTRYIKQNISTDWSVYSLALNFLALVPSHIIIETTSACLKTLHNPTQNGIATALGNSMRYYVHMAQSLLNQQVKMLRFFEIATILVKTRSTHWLNEFFHSPALPKQFKDHLSTLNFRCAWTYVLLYYFLCVYHFHSFYIFQNLCVSLAFSRYTTSARWSHHWLQCLWCPGRWQSTCSIFIHEWYGLD